MPDVPRPAPRAPLPEHEPVPATPWGPNPDYGDLPQRAGDLAVGEYKNLDEVRYRKHTPLKHFHPGPLGFVPTEEVN